MIEFKKMTSEEFHAFREYGIADYSKDLMSGGRLSQEDAMKEAIRAFDSELAGWPDTENQFVMTIEDTGSGEAVGWIWYGYEISGKEKQVFLSDFLIHSDYRRRGYASEALSEMERRAQADGCKAATLFVWDHNPSGIALYSKCGYTPEKRNAGGIFMKKTLNHVINV